MSTVVSPRAPAGAVRRLVPAPGPDDSKPRAGSAQTESRSATLTTDTPPLPTTTRTSRQRLLATRPGKSACRPAATRPLQMSSRRGNRSGGGIPGGRPRDDRDQAGLWPIQTAAGFRQAAGQRRAGALSGVSICRGRVSCSEKNSSDSLSASNLQTFESALAHHKCGELSTNSKCSEQSELRGDCRQSGHRRQICIDEKACGLVLPHLHKQIGFLMPSSWYLKLVHSCFGSIKALALI